MNTESVAGSEALCFPSTLVPLLLSSDAHFVVTGAGGWFGRATLEMLDKLLGAEFDKRVLALASSGRMERLRSGREVELKSLAELANLEETGRKIFIAHYAFLTREKTSGMSLADYASANRAITKFVADQAVRLKATGAFSTSSGAVYQKDRRLADSLEINPYGFLKLEEEAAFSSLRSQTGARVAVCRVFNVSGPFLNKDYALGSLIMDALREPALRVRAGHKVYRSFAHVRDIIAVGFGIMSGLLQDNEQPYDTAGDAAVEVGELAERIRSLLACEEKPILREERPGLPADLYVGDKDAFLDLAKAAGFSTASLDEQIRDTAAYIAATMR